LFNTSMLSRQRVIREPRLWDYDNLQKFNRLEDEKPVFTKQTGWRRWLEPTMAYFMYQWPRDIALQRGLSLEDFYLFNDRELRRDPLWEHICRQSLHPYMHVLFKARRRRYYKVERGLRGFWVPDHIRKDAENRLLKDTVENINEWDEFYEVNYDNDMTPNIHSPTTARLIPLEVFIMYGLFNEHFWTQYFYNETLPEPSQAEVDQIAKDTLDQRKYFDIETEAGKREFEEEVNRFIKLYPGSIVKVSEQFNFKRYYAQYAIQNGRDISKFEGALIEDIKSKLANKKTERNKQLTDKKIPSDQKNTVGTVFPKLLQNKHKKSTSVKPSLHGFYCSEDIYTLSNSDDATFIN